MTRHSAESNLAMMETLHGIASKHAGVSHERLVLLDMDPEQYPGQDISKSVIRAPEGFPLPPEVVSSIANDIDLRYPALETVFAETNESSLGIKRMVKAIGANNNIINGTDHAEIIDVALSQLALTGIVKQEIPVRSGLIVSKMVDFLGVEMHGGVRPVRELLAMGFDSTYLTIPRTRSTEGVFGNRALMVYNGHIIKQIAGDMKRDRRDTPLHRRKPPMLLGVAMPGTVNKPLAGSKTQEVVVGRVNNGVLGFTNVDNTEVVATSIRLDLENPRYFVDDLPMRLSSQEDIEEFMGRLLAGMKELDGGNYVYDTKGNLPVVR